MKSPARIFSLLLIAALALLPIQSMSAKALPPSLTAAILVKLLAFSDAANDDLSIYVMGDEAIADQLESMIGESIGEGRLKRVTLGKDLPSEAPDVLFIGRKANISNALEYTRKEKSMSVASDPIAAGRGVSLVIFDDEGLPGILLNSSSSKREGLSWKPEILEVAQAFEAH